ncbi:MAG: hypothetical protein KDA31_01250 [Phycisphaerales bacterium]|nr:hypothetical protein [Phycisphaerales bacterium]MCB9836951.1 hypothetical protein [Phycisphaera sp.]
MKSAILAFGLLSTAAAAQPVTVSIEGLDADYEIRDLDGFGLTAQAGTDPLLSAVYDLSPPEAEYRSIYQFDLDDLGVQFASINSVTLRLTLESIDNFPAQPVGIWGSSNLRTNPVLDTDAGAVNEYNDASYSELVGDAIVVTNPTLTDVVYDIDVTTFVTNRYGEFDLAPGDSVLMFRTQVTSGFGAEFYNLYSADAASAFRPLLIVDGVAVPTPASACLLGLAGLVAGRRRR